MTPKEKAEILLDKFDLPSGLMSVERKQCAIIAIDELIYYAESKYQLDWFKEIRNELEKL